MTTWRRRVHGVLSAGLPWLLGMVLIPLAAQPIDFSFGAIGQVINVAQDDAPLTQAIAESDADNLAFVVANGFKRADEPCTDELYQHRMDVLDSAKNGLILSLADGDWSACKNTDGRSTAVAALNRLRELFFVDEFSRGASRIPVIRQSNAPQFRSYVENARWEIGNIQFATINLPANNNHYRMEAGRNSEFEDRLIANRDWLKRTFAIATFRKMTGIVLFCDGNPFLKPSTQHLFDSNAKRDGFAEIRQQLGTLAGKFHGKILVIHNRSDTQNGPSNNIAWRGNLGVLELGSDWIKVAVKPENPAVFIASKGSADAKASGQ